MDRLTRRLGNSIATGSTPGSPRGPRSCAAILPPVVRSCNRGGRLGEFGLAHPEHLERLEQRLTGRDGVLRPKGNILLGALRTLWGTRPAHTQGAAEDLRHLPRYRRGRCRLPHPQLYLDLAQTGPP